MLDRTETTYKYLTAEYEYNTILQVDKKIMKVLREYFGKLTIPARLSKSNIQARIFYAQQISIFRSAATQHLNAFHPDSSQKVNVSKTPDDER